MLAILKMVFDAWPAYKDDMTPEKLAKLKERVSILIENAKDAPNKGKPKAIAKRFIDDPDSYTRFTETAGAEPTNNDAERPIRKIVLLRAATQGTRSLAGRRTFERLATIKATCEHQGKSFRNYVYERLQAHKKGEPAPSIIPK